MRRATPLNPLDKRIKDFLIGAVVAVISIGKSPFQELGDVVVSIV
jgi:hypothetical protein